MRRRGIWLLVVLVSLLPWVVQAQVVPPSGGGGSSFPTGSCTNATVTGITASSLTCSPVSALMTDGSIAKTGTDIDAQGRVIATHLPAPLPFLQGGHGLPSGAPGGLVYFPTSTSMGSTQTLPAGMPVLGGGVGGMPTTGTTTAPSSLFATAAGPLTTNRQLMYDESGAVVITPFAPGLPTQPGLTWAITPQTCYQDGNHGKVTVNVTGQLICAPDEGGTGGGSGGLATQVPDGGTTNLVCGTAGRGALQVMDNGEWQYCDGANTSVLHSGVPTQTGLTWGVDPLQCSTDTLNGGKLTVVSGQIVCRPDSGFGTVLAGTAGRVPAYATTGTTLSDSGVLAAQLVTAAVPYTIGGRLVQSSGANRDTSDSGILAANVVTAGLPLVAGRLPQAGGNDRTLSDSGLVAANVLTASLPFVAGNVLQAAGNNRTTADSGLAVSSLCTTTGVCSGYQPLLTWGAGLQVSGTVASVASTEAGFLTDGGTTDLVCGVGNQGKAQVLDSGEWSYCDGAPASVLRKGLPTQSGLQWNVNPATCANDGSGGKLTVTGGGLIQCAPDQGGATSITAVGTVTSGAAFTDLAPGARLTFAPVSLPAIPASGSATLYVMAGAKNLALRDDAGVVKHGVQTRTLVPNNFVTSLDDDGTANVAQPAIATLSDAALVVRTNALNTFGGAGALTGLPTPTNASDAATKSYVDSVSGGLSPRGAVRVATTAALTATYSNGTGGVGATLTNSGTQAALAIDGQTLSVNDRVLVKDQPTPAENGIYGVSVAGTGSTNWVLVRTTDYDANVEIAAGTYVSVAAGTTNLGTLWIQTTLGPFTVGTTPLTFNILNLSQALSLTGDTTGSGIGSIPTTTSKINSVPFSGVAGHLVSFASGTTPGDSGLVAAQVVTASSVFVTGGLLAGAGANRSAQDSGVLAAQVVTAGSAYTAGEVVTAAGNDRTTQTSGVVAALLVSAASPLTNGNLVQGTATARGVSDSGLPATQVVTGPSAFTSGQVVVAAGNNRTTQTSGLTASQLVTAASPYVSGNLVVAAGNNRTTADSGIAASILCTTTSVCSGYQPAGPYAVQGTTITVQGTANEITSSAAGQDLSTSRTWILALANPLNLSGKILAGGSPLVFDGTTVGGFTTTVVVIDPTANRTFTIPNATSVAVQPDTGTPGQYVTAISPLGVISKAAPSFSDFPGTLACSQLPALTGDATTTPGSCVTSVTRLNGGVFSGLAGNLVAFAAGSTPADSAVAAAQVVTASAVFTSGNVVAAAGNNRTLSDGGVAAAQLVSAAGVYAAGQVVVAAGNNRTTQTTGISAANLCTTTGICSGYQAALTAGAGLTLTGATLAVSSTKPGFLVDGGATDLVCGATNQGKAQVMDTGEWQYCDGAPTALLHKGLPTQSGLTWNVNPTTCQTDGNLGKLTVNSSQEIVCAADISGGGGGLITAVGTTTSGAAFADSAPGQRLTFTLLASPSTPALGSATLYVMATAKNLAVMDDAGVVKHGIQTKLPVTSQWLTGVNDAGVASASQPASTDLADSATLPRLTTANTWTGRQDSAGAASTAPFKSGTTLPATCAVNDYFFKNNGTGGANTYACTALNTWTAQGASGGSGTVSLGTVNAVAYYSAVNAVVLPSTGITLSATKLLSTYHATTTISTNTTLGDANIIRCVASGSTVTLTMPSVATTTTGHYTIVKDDATGICQVARAGSDTFNGLAGPLVLSKQYDAIVLDAYDTSSGIWWYTATKAQWGYVQLNMKGADLPTSNAAIIDVSEPRPKLLFDASTSWCASWTFSMNPDYGVLPQIVYKYSMTSPTSGSTKMDWSVWKTTAAQAEDGEVASYDSVNTCTDAAVPATTGRIAQVTCPLVTVDGMAANDQVTIKACRNVTGTATGSNLELLSAQLQYFKQ